MATALVPTKPRRKDVPEGVVLCDHCTAKCCRYFALPLDTPKRRQALAAGLGALETDGLPTVGAAAELLHAEPELAWRIFALALLADELADE